MAQRILGLDIGAASVKAVVVESTYRSWMVTESGRTPVPPDAEGAPPLRERQIEAVKDLLADPRFAFDTAMVALPGPSASHLVALPFSDPRRIEQTIGFEVEGQIPFDLAEVAWDWQLLRSGAEKTELLVAVVRKEELAGLLAGLAGLGVDPRAVLPPGPAYAALFGAGALAGGEPPGPRGAPGAGAGGAA